MSVGLEKLKGMKSFFYTELFLNENHVNCIHYRVDKERESLDHFGLIDYCPSHFNDHSVSLIIF